MTAGAGTRASPGHRRLPPLLTAVAGVVSVVVLLPLAFLVVQAVQIGWAQLHQLLFRDLTAMLVWHTVALVVVVMVLCVVVGTLAAWFVERTDLPCRRLFAILVVIPLGIPDFVVSFGWRGLFPSIGGFWAAVLVMTLAVYPLVFLPVAASLRAADPAQEEVARSLGLGRLQTFWTVTVGQARMAIFGGAILVGLVVLAEFGAFEILGYQTLTTEIYSEFQVGFNEPAACALSLILVLLGGLLLASEDTVRGRGRTSRVGAGAARPIRPVALGRARPTRAGGRCPPGGAGSGRTRRCHRLPDRPGRQQHPPACIAPHRHGEHLRVRSGRRRGGDGGGASHRAALRPFPRAPRDRPPADQHARAGRAGSRHRRSASPT